MADVTEFDKDGPQPTEAAPSMDDDSKIVTAVAAYKKEATDAKRTRMRRNRVNRNAYFGLQDWTHKNEGQSQEFIPKVPIATDQFVAFIKRALTQFGDWYTVELGRDSKSFLSEPQIRKLLSCFLDHTLSNDNVISTFPTILADAVKIAALESLMVLKIHGHGVLRRDFGVEPGVPFIDNETGQVQETDPTLQPKELRPWHLRIDLVRLEDYFPDPTGRGLYEIHRTENDIHYVMERAREGIYDMDMVRQLSDSLKETDEHGNRKHQQQNQDRAQKPGFRRVVQLDECWGTLLNEDGEIVHENVVCTVANEMFLIRKPTPNPFWHGESPFVVQPLIRVPFSVWHKALMDHATQLNLAQNELFNLMLDGGMASVWGIKQLRVDDLDDPSQVQGGIPQGETLIVKNTLPPGGKVLEKVSEGDVPNDAMAMYEALNREGTAAALSNELKLGALPPKQVKATEIMEMSQSQAVTLDSISGDIERDVMAQALRKCWMVILQNMEDVSSKEVIAAIGTKGALKLSQMSKAERFAMFAGKCNFKVNGISAVLGKVRDFQKMMALLQSVVQNPILLQSFFKKYSPDRVLAHIMKSLNINPDNMARDEQEQGRVLAELEELPIFNELASRKGGGTQNGGGAGLSAQQVGDPSTGAEINQQANPLTGLAGT